MIVALFFSENSIFVGWASWKPAAVDIVNQNLSFLRRAAFLSKEDFHIIIIFFHKEIVRKFWTPRNPVGPVAGYQVVGIIEILKLFTRRGFGTWIKKKLVKVMSLFKEADRSCEEKLKPNTDFGRYGHRRAEIGWGIE